MKYIDLKTLSKETSLSVYTLRKFVKKGLSHYRIGRKVLVKPDEFDAWMKQFRKTKNANDEIDRIVNEILSDLRNK